MIHYATRYNIYAKLDKTEDGNIILINEETNKPIQLPEDHNIQSITISIAVPFFTLKSVTQLVKDNLIEIGYHSEVKTRPDYFVIRTKNTKKGNLIKIEGRCFDNLYSCYKIQGDNITHINEECYNHIYDLILQARKNLQNKTQ